MASKRDWTEQELAASRLALCRIPCRSLVFESGFVPDFSSQNVGPLACFLLNLAFAFRSVSTCNRSAIQCLILGEKIISLNNRTDYRFYGLMYTFLLVIFCKFLQSQKSIRDNRPLWLRLSESPLVAANQDWTDQELASTCTLYESHVDRWFSNPDSFSR